MLCFFGTYVQALQENNPTNTTNPQTIGCIYLDSLDKENQGYELLNLTTNKVITHRRITEIPATDLVISRVEELATADGMKPDLVLADCKGTILLKDQFIAGVDHHDDNNDNNDDDNDNKDEEDRNNNKNLQQLQNKDNANKNDNENETDKGEQKDSVVC